MTHGARGNLLKAGTVQMPFPLLLSLLDRKRISLLKPLQLGHRPTDGLVQYLLSALQQCSKVHLYPVATNKLIACCIQCMTCDVSNHSSHFLIHLFPSAASSFTMLMEATDNPSAMRSPLPDAHQLQPNSLQFLADWEISELMLRPEAEQRRREQERW